MLRNAFQDVLYKIRSAQMEPSNYQEHADLNVYPEVVKQVDDTMGTAEGTLTDPEEAILMAKTMDDTRKPAKRMRGSRLLGILGTLGGIAAIQAAGTAAAAASAVPGLALLASTAPLELVPLWLQLFPLPLLLLGLVPLPLLELSGQELWELQLFQPPLLLLGLLQELSEPEHLVLQL